MIVEKEEEISSEVKLTTDTSSEDISSIIKNIGKVSDMLGIGEGNSEGGLIGGLILGSLLRNGGNLFGNNGVAGAVAAPIDVQTALNSQSLGQLKGEVWQAEGQVQLAIANSTIAGLQGEAHLTKAITDSASTGQVQSLQAELAILASVGNAAKEAAVANALTNSNIALGQAATAALIAQSKFDIAQVVTNDGDKTRDLISSINLATLNRELAVAQGTIADERNHSRHAATEVNVNQTVNQAQAQAQQQQQFQVISSGLATLLGEIQRNTQSTVAIGSTLTGNSQTATNNRVS
jgi:hypothetical protein